MNPLVLQMVNTFHYVISEESGNDVTIARAKSMIALASLTWPALGIVVTPNIFGQGRMTWRSDDFNSVTMGGAFRRDPVGDDASIIIDHDDQQELVMEQEMRDCAGFIPLFGRQRMERFNMTVAEILEYRNSKTPLPEPDSESNKKFFSEEEYQRLFIWLIEHGVIDNHGNWLQSDFAVCNNSAISQ